MHHFKVETYKSAAKKRPAYKEFLRVPAMSMGVYTIPPGALDTQQPHTEDETYYIVSGRGAISVGDEDMTVDAGSLIYVPAQVEHRFHSVEETLAVLVFFAPAEYSLESNT